ncbi:DUF1475 family protein [Halanaerobiaceae bacterium Z-7014]|uniref:DUF1475 family protein n=1 Tax=Halonatronomonas betaini TaxID=2778430 RepID=A0A931FA11_9FIRM|nr:DUF1475 family protein [Halonatronomonas betaini]MBF8436452.1 DUF1475 family protein [Halonatronomonas betaini]
MKITKIVSWLGLIAMVLVISNGFINGSFTEDGGELLANPWGIVSLVDLYVGFIIFSLWIAFREKTIQAKIIWIALMMVFGFLTASLYTLITAYKSEGNWLKFFLGARKDSLINSEQAVK